MIPTNLWQHQNAVKTLYSRCVGGVCKKHGISRVELDILLFLANNPCFDTATDIVEIRYLTKSQVSEAVKRMEECGCLKREYRQDNRKTAHLRICDAAAEIILDGRAAQEKFAKIMMKDVPQEEIDCTRRCMSRIYENIRQYLKEEHLQCTNSSSVL